MENPWRPDLATGLQQIDLDHQRIHQQIEQLVKRAESGHELAAARSVVGELKRHVVEHFAAEYQFMAAYAYPALEEHHAEHDEIRSYVFAFEDELLEHSEEPELLVAATRVLSNWILTHTETFDRDFARFVRDQS